MPSYVDPRFQSRGPSGVLVDALVLLTKDTLLHGRCQHPTFVSERATSKEFDSVVRSK